MQNRSRPWPEIAGAINAYLLEHYRDEGYKIHVEMCRIKDVSLPLLCPLPPGVQLGLPFQRSAEGTADEQAGAPEEQEEAPTPAEALTPAEAITPARRSWHSEDWRTIEWAHRRYLLSPMQSLIVQQLWERAEEQPEHPEVREGDLLNGADSECQRLVDLFRRSPAWRSLVVRGPGDTFRLAELPAAEGD